MLNEIKYYTVYHELNNRVNLDHIDKICEVVGCDLTDILKYESRLIRS
ncbi:helix-turn-helix domain-containing protein [Clostridium beijerinckii]|nr:helix-turn-helix transcriptional regulator [Clostridium beijerinckii]